MPFYTSNTGGKLAAPEAHVQVIAPASGKVSPVIVGLLDSGASMTCLPLDIIETLRPLDYRFVRVLGVLEEREMRVFRVDLRVHSCIFYGLEVIGFNRPYALIGRDILNGYSVVLDGKRQEWRVIGDDRC